MNINIAVTGRKSSGKTSLIASIYESARIEMPGYFSLPEAQDFDALDKSFRELKAKAESTRQDFTVDFAPREIESWSYIFRLKGSGGNLDMRFQENPETISGTDIFIAVIDAPLLMGGHEDLSGVKEAQGVFSQALEGSDRNKLLIVVPVKCEAYTRSDINALTEKIASSFSTLTELSQGKHKGRSSIVILPVNTMGGASFYDFAKSDGKITGEIFRRDKNTNFSPENAAQVMRIILTFLACNFTGYDKLIAQPLKLKPDDGKMFEILTGHELFDPDAAKSHSKKPRAIMSFIKVAIIAIIIIGLAGAGYYALKKIDSTAKAALDENARRTEEAITEANARADQEISEAHEAYTHAVFERNKAREEAKILREEKERAVEMAGKYKKQIDDLKAENKQLKAEVERLTQKLNDSIIRIPNPFK